MADEIRTDTSPEAMIRAIEDNTLDRWRVDGNLRRDLD